MFSFRQYLEEKLIIVGGGKRYGQIIFTAGGAGSGKGFAVAKFIEGAKFKIRDVDEWKKMYLRFNELKNRYPELKGLNLRRPKDVSLLHDFVKSKGIKEKSLDAILGAANNPETLPNILFDITLKDMSDLTDVLPRLLETGYKPENIHLVWVLTDYQVAFKANLERDRVVPESIFLTTHKGAADTMQRLVDGNIPRGLNGAIHVVLNNREETVVFTPGQQYKGRTITPMFKPKKGDEGVIVRDFTYLTIKREGKPPLPEITWKRKLWGWITGNAPEDGVTKEALWRMIGMRKIPGA
jgi:dephospho-CoA kinase